ASGDPPLDDDGVADLDAVVDVMGEAAPASHPDPEQGAVGPLTGIPVEAPRGRDDPEGGDDRVGLLDLSALRLRQHVSDDGDLRVIHALSPLISTLDNGPGKSLHHPSGSVSALPRCCG